MFGMATEAPDAEMLSLLDVEPFSVDEIAYIARRLLSKLNKTERSRLTVDEDVQLRLISAFFRT